MLYIGIDAGGSKTKLLARCQGHEDLMLIGPAANLQAVGAEGVAHIFTDLVHQALELREGEPLQAACAGVAGAGRAEDSKALETAWRQHLGTATPPHLHVVHDAAIAVEAAFEGASGIIVIVGTGSIAFAKSKDGTLHRVGGWGYLIGDEGSGFVIGLEALRAVAWAIDGGPATLLRPLIDERLGIRTADELIHGVYRDKLRPPLVAPLVIEAAESGDAVAQHIIDDQLGKLAHQVQWLVRRCGDVEHQIAPIGGLTQNPFFRAALERSLLASLPGWKVMDPAHDPVVGALRFALQAASAP